MRSEIQRDTTSELAERLIVDGNEDEFGTPISLNVIGVDVPIHFEPPPGFKRASVGDMNEAMKRIKGELRAALAKLIEQERYAK